MKPVILMDCGFSAINTQADLIQSVIDYTYKYTIDRKRE
jgi:hypothetical protein